MTVAFPPDQPGPVNVVVNGRTERLPAGTTVADLLSRLKFPQRGVAVEVNLTIVPRQRHAEHRLQEGDRLEVVSLVGGG
jgi:sulfur carrier protein